MAEGPTVYGPSITLYIDLERVRKEDGYVYWWDLVDYTKPFKPGVLSSKSYNQGDCKLFQFKSLSYSEHKEHMGGGTGVIDNNRHKEWECPPPGTVVELILTVVCNLTTEQSNDKVQT